LEILGITGFVPAAAPGPGPLDGLAAARAAHAAEGPLERPYDSRQRALRGWPALSMAQIAILNQRWGLGNNYNNVNGIEWSPGRDRRGGRQKTYRKRVSIRKTKKHI
jgi:hypothetical protein